MSKFRYCEVTDDVIRVFLDVLDNYYNKPEIVNLKIKLLFDTKKRIKKGKITLADIEKPNPKVKYFSADENALDGYDYIIFLDMVAWHVASTIDKIRLIRHELRHIFIDEDGNCKIIDHDVCDFSEEIELNYDDPNWGSQLAIATEAKYEDLKNGGKLNENS